MNVKLAKGARGGARMLTTNRGRSVIVYKDKPVDLAPDEVDGLMQAYPDMLERVGAKAPAGKETVKTNGV